jgi:DNA-binding CsgD family transcriptional regulator
MRRGRPPYPDTLTPREQEVLTLLREGLTNQQIADRLGISESGARYHVSEILSKLSVSSREEAASWRPEGRVFGAGLVIALRRAATAVGRLGAGAAFAVATALGLALVLGVGVMSSRGGGDHSVSPAVTARAEQAESIRELLDLASEATREARSVLPGAELVFVAYSMPSGSYTFRFTQAGSQTEVSLLGPSDGVPGAPRWQIVLEERSAGAPALPVLNLSSVQSSVEAVADAAASKRMGSSAANMGLVVFSDSGMLKWNVMAIVNLDQLVRCEALDADLGGMTCGEPIPSQGAPTTSATP